MYYSSVNCTFRISSDESSERRISEAYALRVNRTDTIMPYFSWSDRYAKSFIEGTIIVEGALILNVNKLNYLVDLIKGQIGGLEVSSEITDTILTSSVFSNFSYKDVEKARFRLEMLKQLEEANISNLQLKDNAIPNLNTILKVYTEGKITEEITNVHFTGKSFEITAGSAMNIKYAFPFVAQKSSI